MKLKTIGAPMTQSKGRTAAKETEEPSKKKNKLSEAEIAASDAARDLADLEEATEASAKTSGVPTALLERRLNKSKEKVEELQKDKLRESGYGEEVGTVFGVG